jgi:hypothetical protein
MLTVGSPSSSFRTLERQGGDIQGRCHPTLSLQKTERRGWGTHVEDTFVDSCAKGEASPSGNAEGAVYHKVCNFP